MNATFGVDLDGSQNRGITCSTSLGSSPGETLLYDSFHAPLTQGPQHTLFIMNGGDRLSLGSFEVFGDMEPTTVIPQTPSSMPNLPPPSASSPSNPSLTSPDTTTVTTLSGSDASPHNSAPVAKTTTLLIPTTIAVQQIHSDIPGPSQGLSKGAVAGAAIGSLLLLLLLTGVGLWWWRRRRNRVRFLYGISNLDFGTFLTTYSLQVMYRSIEKMHQMPTSQPAHLGSSRARAMKHAIETQHCMGTLFGHIRSQSATHRSPRIWRSPHLPRA